MQNEIFCTFFGISGEIKVVRPFLCCTVCKVSMDGGPTDDNAVNLHFVANDFTHFLVQWYMQTIVDHCPQNFKNH